MLKLYTDRSKFDKRRVLFNNDAVFNAYTHKKKFDKIDHALMLKYDGAVIVGKNDIATPVTTKYGFTDITKLSTGLKTLLNLRNMNALTQYDVIDITEAGKNVISDIFSYAEQMNIPVILSHADLPKLDGQSILVNDAKEVTEELELFQLILERWGDDEKD